MVVVGKLATRLAEAHKTLQTRLQVVVAEAVAAIWRALGHYDRIDVDPFLAQALPVVFAGQQQSANLVAAYIAHSMRLSAFGIDPARISGPAVRSGTAPEVVYSRPFIQTWHDLSQGKSWTDAVQAGESRVKSSASMDVSLAQRASFQVAQDDVSGIYGYQRVASANACPFCQAISGAYVKSAFAMPLHNNCNCTLEPLTKVHPNAKWLPDGTHITDAYAVHEHGELGPVLTNPDDHFTPAPEDVAPAPVDLIPAP